ncbi:MAG: cytochrome c3 family protein [Armatimonadota bacterium]
MRLLIIVTMIASAGMLTVPAALLRADDPPATPAGDTAPQPPAYAGTTLCKGCHAKLYQPWAETPHGQTAASTEAPEDLKGCEACHGPAAFHVANRKERPQIPTADDAEKTNATCGACHFKKDGSKAPKDWQNIPYASYAHSRHTKKGLACLSCHTGHPNGNEKALKKTVPELCMDCHAGVLESSPGKKADYTHFPVADGQCQKCHDPHGTPNGRMVVKNIQAVCKECHDTADPAFAPAHRNIPAENADCTSCHNAHSHDATAKLIGGKKHMPFKSGRCETCHAKTEPGQGLAFTKPKNQLCFTCHPANKLMPESDKAHAPVKSGLCIACHDPHISREKALLKNRQANVCFTCHKQIEKETISTHRHKILDSTMNCALCHQPHSAPNDHLMVKNYQSLCGQCHKHSFSHPMDKRQDGTPVIDPNTKTPVVCSSCHDMHGGEFEKMTKGSKDRELCVRCHTVGHE